MAIKPAALAAVLMVALALFGPQAAAAEESKEAVSEKPKIVQEGAQEKKPALTSEKDSQNVVRSGAAAKTSKPTLGVDQDTWVNNLKFISEIKDPAAFLALAEKKLDAWYLADMIAMKSPKGNLATRSSIYMYHKKAMDNLKVNPPALAYTNEISVNVADAAALVDILHYALKEKHDLKDEELADILVYGAGMVSRGVMSSNVRHVVVMELRNGRTVPMLLEDMLDKTPRKGLGQL